MKPTCARHDAPAPHSCQRCGDFLCSLCLKDPIFILCKDCFGQKHQAWIEGLEKSMPWHIALMCLGHFLVFSPLLFALFIYLDIGGLFFDIVYAVLGVFFWELYRFLIKWSRLSKNHEDRAVKYRRAEQNSIDSIEAFLKLSEEEQKDQLEDFVGERGEILKKWEGRAKEEANRDIELRDVPVWLSLPATSFAVFVSLWVGIETIPGILFLIYFGQAFVRVCLQIYGSLKNSS